MVPLFMALSLLADGFDGIDVAVSIRIFPASKLLTCKTECLFLGFGFGGRLKDDPGVVVFCKMQLNFELFELFAVWNRLLGLGGSPCGGWV